MSFIISMSSCFYPCQNQIFLHPICRNILTLTNDLEIPDKKITLENYDDWIKELNRTNPDVIASLGDCDLQTFLDQVLLIRSMSSLPPLHVYNITPSHSLSRRLHQGQAWLLSHSLKRS